MTLYSKWFDTHSEYETYKNGQNYILPNVSYCVDLNELHFEKPRDYSKEYLTFEAIEDTKYGFSSNGLFYSFDGKTWVSLASGTTTPTINAGDKVMFKGNKASEYGIGTFSSSGKYNVLGNVMSLLFGDDFIGQTDLTGRGQAFKSLFMASANLVDASNLILPATTLTDYCYKSMFKGCSSLDVAPKLPATTLAGSCYESMFEECTSLITAPELPATILKNYCYIYMFLNCKNLNYIKAMFTTNPTSRYTSNWVSGVSSTGTFIKNSTATWNVTGTEGIPSGWTVQTESA